VAAAVAATAGTTTVLPSQGAAFVHLASYSILLGTNIWNRWGSKRFMCLIVVHVDRLPGQYISHTAWWPCLYNGRSGLGNCRPPMQYTCVCMQP
jgi:hypothetical protein